MGQNVNEPDSPTEDPAARAPTRVPLADSTRAAVIPPSIPERVGNYHLKRPIATGGMGSVYEAIQDQPRRTVALKLMRPGLLDAAARRRFEYESQILARLRHPSIAQVYEAGTWRFAGPGGVETEVPYFAMEFVPDARALTDYAAERKLTTVQRLELFAEVCDAVHHGHQKGILHRDLKPANILVDPSGRPKVIDFGVARAVDADLAGTILQTEAGQLIGTIQYMSPEQVEGDSSELDARSDVYSLGVVLYELLTRITPYDLSGTPAPRASRVIREQPPVRPSSIDASLRGDAETVILTALHKDRERRYQSAAALAHDIRCLLASRPIAARLDSAVYIIRTRARAAATRHPVAASLGALAVGWGVCALPLVPRLVISDSPVGAWFERTAMGLVQSPAGDAMKDVRVVGITEDTDLEGLARAEGIEGVRREDKPSRRLLYSRLVERLVDAGVRPRVVMWDFQLLAEGPNEFPMALQRLREAGVESVVAVDWPLGADQPPDMQAAILDAGVRWGGYTFNWPEQAPWQLDMVAVRPGQAPKASLALESYAASLHPGHLTEYFLDELRGVVEIRFRPSLNGASPAPRLLSLGHFNPVRIGEAEGGLRPGDSVGKIVLDMPSDAVLEQATVLFADAFGVTDEFLRATFDQRAVVFADLSEPKRSHPGGRAISPPYVHAVGLDMLMRGMVIRLPRPVHIQGLLAGSALIGVGAAWACRGRIRWLLPLLLAIGAVGFGLSMFAVRQAAYLCNPAVPVLSMLSAAAVAAWVVGSWRASLARRA